MHFYLVHWQEIEALSDGDEGAVRDLRESLRYEYDHLGPSDLMPCICGSRRFNPPRAGEGGGGSVGGRSFGDLVPSIESAYEQLPITWQGRTKVWLLMRGYSEQEIYELRQDAPRVDGRRVKGQASSWDQWHAERIRAETRRPGFRLRPQDTDEEAESVWRRMATVLGWSPRAIESELNQDKEQAAA